MSGEKRKRPAVVQPSQDVKVSHIGVKDQWAPVLVYSPGICLPDDSSFKPYKRARTSSSQSTASKNDLLLHSSRHAKLDFTACEEVSNGSESHLKHYVGIFDEITGRLNIVPARKLTVRSTLRASTDPEDSDDASQKATMATNNFAARTKLGLAFGTKKSQKAIKNLTSNAIQASPAMSQSRPNGTGSSQRALDPLSEAVISSMAAPTASMPTREEMQAQADENMPRPKANLDARTPAEVYPVEVLVGGEHILRMIAVKEWIDAIQSGGDVPTASLFVSRRIVKVVQSGDVKMVRVLRYLLLLLSWYRSLKQGAKGLKRVPKLEDMGHLVSTWGGELVAGLAKRFSQDNTLNKWYQHLVLTHILALALAVDGWDTDVFQIREDLKMDVKDLAKLYAELGCPLRLPSDAERAQLKITKAEAGGHKHAQLKLPLVFPKLKTRRK